MSTTYYIRQKAGIGTISLRYRKGKSTNIIIATPFKIEVEKWDPINECYNESLKKKNPKNSLDKEYNSTIETFNLQFRSFKLKIEKLILDKDFKATSEDFKNFISHNYKHKKKKVIIEKNTVPTLFTDFIEYYIEQKTKFSIGIQKPITVASIKKYRVIKNKIIKINSKLKLNEIDDEFRDHFIEWNLKNKYSIQTIVKELKFIKTFITYADAKRLKINKDVLNWTFYVAPKEYKEPTLSFEELKKIEETEMPFDYLDNARDWLIIGCYSAQRVSDLLKFEETKIIEDDFLEFTQKKGNQPIVIYMLPKVKQILNKRNGEFPRRISDQKFNKYIKEVCKIAGLNEKLIGGKMVNKRKLVGEYHKWELVTSHICRRSYVSNFRHILGDENVMAATGHKSPKMLDIYDQRKELEKAKQTKDKITEITKLYQTSLNLNLI